MFYANKPIFYIDLISKLIHKQQKKCFAITRRDVLEPGSKKKTRKTIDKIIFLLLAVSGGCERGKKTRNMSMQQKKKDRHKKEQLCELFFSASSAPNTHHTKFIDPKAFQHFFPRVSRRVSLQRGAKPTRRNSKQFFFFSGINIEKHSNLYLLKAHKQRQLSDYRYSERLH